MTDVPPEVVQAAKDAFRDRTIWKYELMVGETVLELPLGARPLAVQVQGGKPCLWCLVYPNRPTEERHFVVYGTGHPLPGSPRTYLGTFQLFEGTFVGHVFEEHE